MLLASKVADIQEASIKYSCIRQVKFASKATQIFGMLLLENLSTALVEAASSCASNTTYSPKIIDRLANEAEKSITNPLAYYLWRDTFDLYVFNYGVECRALLLKDDIVWDTSPYWVNRLPFVKTYPDGKLKSVAATRVIYCDQHEEGDIFVPNSNHFGHFLLDSLPYLSSYLMALSTGSSQNCSIITLHSISSIRELISSVLPNNCVRELALPEPGTALLYKNIRFTYPFGLNYISQVFLARKLLSLRQPIQENANKMRKIALCRKPNQSRIANRTEVIGEIKSLGYQLVFPEDHSISDVYSLLSSAEICVSEPGSCFLNAMLMCSSSCLTISLLPAECVFNPTNDMIISGWPYIYGHPNFRLILSDFYSNLACSDPMTAVQREYNINHMLEVLAL
ncbi:glycosyltransferase 61 family protein [Synechococcus sp. UW140]|uniref:glycosyltransferase 61 family protein n=1 Tax=Synechococcus sp. UW140 TaxID=368503 RepID=UPI003137C112